LLEALGLRAPLWYHAPLVLDAMGRRLAKRADALALATLRCSGVDPRAIIGWVMDSAGFDTGARLTPGEATAVFDIERLRREPSVLSEQVLAELLAAR
jgi:glutamyl/glutaminyl-tRNA synthetase